MLKKFLASFLLLISTANAQVITPGSTPVGGLSLPGGKSGRFFTTPLHVSPGGAALAAANKLFATPIFISAPSTLASLSFNITTGNAAAWNARMCLYADSSGTPGALVVDSGTVAIASGSVTGVQAVGSLNASLGGPAWYWAAIMADSASESLSSAGTSSGVLLGLSILGASSAAAIPSATITTGISASQTFGACPATFPTPISYNSGGSTPVVILGF